MIISSSEEIYKTVGLSDEVRRIYFNVNLRICSCLACVYRVMDARGKFGEHERCVRVARGDSRVQL